MSVTAKANIHPIFVEQIEKLRQYAQDEDLALRGQQQPYFYCPDKKAWNGDLFDLTQMSLPFVRTDFEGDFFNVVSSPDASGVTGDLALIQTQGDFLSAMERAYRARHQTMLRNQAHAAGRRRGHGMNSIGLFVQGLQGYVEHLSKTSKSERPSV